MAKPSGQYLVVNPFVNQQTGAAAEDSYALIVNCTDPTSPSPEPTPEPGVGEPAPTPEPGVEPDPVDNPNPPPTGDDEAEPNNAVTQAFALACNDNGFFVSNDEDFYQVAVPDNYSLEVSVVTAGSPLDMRVLSIDGETVIAEATESTSSTTSSRTGTASLEALAGGDYVVWVSRPQGLATSYSLLITCDEVPEVNTTCSHASGERGSSSPWSGALGFLLGGVILLRRKRKHTS
ncbi:MAG: hypothetical protein GY822_08920 [Deltaproteobacteria bacterium]|nr:hypothetical protein [Deltaproteobacteria bacterium]